MNYSFSPISFQQMYCLCEIKFLDCKFFFGVKTGISQEPQKHDTHQIKVKYFFF